MQIIDIGCGPNKLAGAIGVDGHPFPGVDHVFDFDLAPWPLASNSFDVLRAIHVIEHVASTKTFLKEIHRIAKPNAVVLIETPHFSWIDSWSDPTHQWHFSSDWYACLTKGEYLSHIVGEFELISTEIEFNKTLRGLIPRMICKLFSRQTYEKHYAFLFPARNIITKLRVIK